MKTEDLIGLLAAGETRVAPHLVRQRFAAAMGWSIPLGLRNTVALLEPGFH